MWSNSELGYIDDEEELRHYGVKGMKWKKHKKRAEDAAAEAQRQAEQAIANAQESVNRALLPVKRKAQTVKGRAQYYTDTHGIDRYGNAYNTGRGPTATSKATAKKRSEMAYANKVVQNPLTPVEVTGKTKAIATGRRAVNTVKTAKTNAVNTAKKASSDYKKAKVVSKYVKTLDKANVSKMVKKGTQKTVKDLKKSVKKAKAKAKIRKVERKVKNAFKKR